MGKGEIKLAMKRAQREVLIEHALRHRNMTIGDLIELDGEAGDIARSITIRELLVGKAVRSARPASARGDADARGRRRKVETRTDRGRKRYDAAMLAELQAAADPLAASALRAAVGGSPMQARRSLNRLIEAGSVTYTGKAGGTRYQAAKT